MGQNLRGCSLGYTGFDPQLKNHLAMGQNLIGTFFWDAYHPKIISLRYKAKANMI